MAGTYTRKEFALEHPEEQTLLKDSNGTRIIPLKGEKKIKTRIIYIPFPYDFRGTRKTP